MDNSCKRSVRRIPFISSVSFNPAKYRIFASILLFAIQLFAIHVFCLWSITLYSVDSQELHDTKTKIVYIYAPFWGDLFDISNPNVNRDNCLEPMYRFKNQALKNGYELRHIRSLDTLGDFEYLLVFEVPFNQFHKIHKYPKEKLILFLWEPPSVIAENYLPQHHEIFSKVYTWHDGLVDGNKYIKFHYPVLVPMINSMPKFHEKKLAALIGCNKNSTHPNELYSQRLRVIRLYEEIGGNQFDLYGPGWPSDFKNYRGTIPRKVDVLKGYKFCYAYENIKGIPGYVTEKIFDCFHAGCVPIYWGAPNVNEFIPKNCYIDRSDFKDEMELFEYLRGMNETEYNQYISNIQRYLDSPEAQVFAIDTFVDTCIKAISAPIGHQNRERLSASE